VANGCVVEVWNMAGTHSSCWPVALAQLSPSPFLFYIFSSRSSHNVKKEHQRTSLCCVASSGEVATGQRTFRERGGELRRSRLLSAKVIPLHREVRLRSRRAAPRRCDELCGSSRELLLTGTGELHGIPHELLPTSATSSGP
jgi:hypothetical protein